MEDQAITLAETIAGPRTERRALRWYLVALALVSLFPLLVFTGTIIWRHIERQREAHRRGMIETSATLSLAVDREWGAAVSALNVLALSPLIERGDYESFYRICSAAAAERRGSYIILFDPTGKQLFNTGRPYGGPLPNPFTQSVAESGPNVNDLPRGNPDTVREAFATGQPVYSHLFISLSLGRPVVTVDVPVKRDGKTIHVLTMGMFPERFAELLQEQRGSGDWLAGIFESRGRMIARSRESDRYLGWKVRSDMLEQSQGDEQGFMSFVNLQGEDNYRAWTRSKLTGWISVISVPQSSVDAPLYQSLAFWAGGAAVFLGVGLVLALLAARWVTEPIAALAKSAERVQRGEQVPMPHTMVREVQELYEAMTYASEAVRRHAEEQEQRKIAETRRELAEAENRGKDQFLAVLGHELRNPLAAIVNGTQLLGKGGNLDARAAGISQLIGRQARYMTRLVDDLLDLSRIGKGKIRLRTERVDLTDLLGKIVADQQIVASETRCSLELKTPSEALWVEADPARVAQMVGNLLHNACKFTDPGGVVTIIASVDPRQSVARIDVRDTGVGMTPQTIAHIFKPFNQAPGTLDRNHNGLGLGLALVRSMAELHGGTISATSAGPGKGSVFTLTLPLAPSPAYSKEAPFSPGRSPARADHGGFGAKELVMDDPAVVPQHDKEPAKPNVADESPAGERTRFRVLLVEDSAPVAEIFQMMLEEMGHEVRLAVNGFEALKELERFSPEVIFSDLSMPKMSGCELASRIRRQPRHAGAFLVAVTAFGQPQDREQSLAAGFDEHIVKPVDVARLTAVFAMVSQRWVSADQTK